MTKVLQTKIPVTLTEDGNLQMDENLFDLITRDKPNWKLVRERDGLTKQSKDIKWLGFNEDGTFKEQFKEVAVGRSLMMSPFTFSFTWQTTEVTEIVEQRDDYIKFKTKNSNYELFKI